MNYRNEYGELGIFRVHIGYLYIPNESAARVGLDLNDRRGLYLSRSLGIVYVGDINFSSKISYMVESGIIEQ